MINYSFFEMKRFKTIARAISPFVGKKKDTKPAKRDIDNSNNSKASMETSDFSWNLKDVDMTKVLKAFYKTYNPDKVKMTAHILENYAGEEILMLQQLCERYNLSEADMQMYVDQGRVIRRDKSANKRAGDQNSETSTVQMTSKHGLDKSVSRGGSVIDASKYTWNIENVDIAWALKLFHKKYKPGKTHNYSVLKYKSDAEIIKLLRDLCEKYSLEEFQMQYYLDRAVINGDNNTVTSRYSASKNSNHEIEDDIFSISTNNRSVQSTNPTSPRANQFETLRKEQSNMSESHQHQSRVKCTPPPPPPSPPKDKTPTTKQAIPQSNSTRHDVSTLSAANNHFKLPTSVQVPVSSMLQQDIDDISRLSMEDVQEPVYHVSRASAVANNPPKQPTIEEEPVTKEAKHKSVKDMIPPQILPNGRRFTLGPVLSEITKRNKPADVTQPNDSDERESSQAKSLLPPSKHEESKPIPKEPKPEPHRRSIVDSSHISSQKPFVAPVTERKFHDRVEQSNPAKSERKEVKTTDNSELKKMQNELSNTRRQLELVKKESQEMIEAMKESAQKAIMMTTTLASQKKNSNANESVSRSNKFDSSSESKLIDLSGVEEKKVNTIKKTLPRGIPGSMRELSRMSGKYTLLVFILPLSTYNEKSGIRTGGSSIRT